VHNYYSDGLFKYLDFVVWNEQCMRWDYLTLATNDLSVLGELVKWLFLPEENWTCWCDENSRVEHKLWPNEVHLQINGIVLNCCYLRTLQSTAVNVYTTCFSSLWRFILPTKCIYRFNMIFVSTAIISLNNINQLIFMLEKCSVFFEV
jgi:hypothetical protein